MHRAPFVAASALALSLCAGCADLSPYPVDECGNSVVEESLGEQCDAHVAPGSACGAPGSAAPCRYLCSVLDGDEDADTRYTCPDGFACGIDDVCHRAAGTFALSATDTAFALASRLGDFDGTRTDDVLTSGLSRLDVSFYDDDGILASRQSLGGGLQVPPGVGDLDGPSDDGTTYDDVVFTKSGDVVVALGSDQGLTPKSYAGIRLDLAPPAFFFTVPHGYQKNLDLDVTLVLDGGPTFQLEQLSFGQISFLIDWPFEGDAPRDFVTANFDPKSTCDEVVFAYEDFLASWLPCPNIDTLATGEVGGDPVPPVRLDFETIPGLEGRRIVGRPALVKLDGNDALDVVVEVNECPDEPDACAFFEDAPSDCCHLYLGWGMTRTEIGPDLRETIVPTGRFSSQASNGGEPDTLGRFEPLLALETDEGPQVSIHPIGWGDLNGDGLGDLVTQNGAFIGTPFGSQPRFFAAALNQGLPWRDAVIADFDADGYDDIVAAPFLTPALTFLRGNPGSTMTYATLQVERPYDRVFGGDLDGDGRRDIVGLTRSTDGARDDLAVHYYSDGSFAAPRVIGSFPVEVGDPGDVRDDESSILQLDIGKIRTSPDALDSIDDAAVITTYTDTSNSDRRVGIALFEGSADRQLTAPIVVSTDEGSVDVELATFGHFESGLPTIVAERFFVDLDASLEILGASQAITVLGDEALRAAFRPGIDIKPTTLAAAGNWDDDPDDELAFVVPGCDTKKCTGPQSAGNREECCEDGSEETLFFLLDKRNGEFGAASVAPLPLTFDGEAGRLYVADRGLRGGRLQLVDLDADGISEALILVNESLDDVSSTHAVLVSRRGGALGVSEVPRAIVDGDTTIETNVYGFAATHDPDGHPLLVIASREGVYQVPVDLGEDGDGPTFAFGEPTFVLDAQGQPLLREEVTSVEAGDVNGDGIDDLVLTRPFSTDLYLGAESLAPPAGTP